jgi:prepilin-type N-terminal cleavage/methylation domain-containing protein
MKKAFTLIELLISIFLLGLIVNFLYTAIGNLQKTNMLFSEKSKALHKDQKLLDLLYDDIFFAKELKITGSKNSFLDLRTANSLFDIEEPYVSWLIGKENNTLLRFESTLPFSKMTSDNNKMYHISNAGKECERFHIYKSKDKNNILINIKFKEREPLIYEFFKPMSVKDTNETNKTSKKRKTTKK